MQTGDELLLHQVDLSFFFPLNLIFNLIERVMRIELTSPAWEAGVIAIIRHPQHGRILSIVRDEKNVNSY